MKVNLSTAFDCSAQVFLCMGYSFCQEGWKSMIGFDQYAYNNKLTNMHPLEKFSFAMISLITCVAVDVYPVSLMVLFTMSFSIVYWAGISSKVLLKMLLLPFSFLILGIGSIVVGISESTVAFTYYIEVGKYSVGSNPTMLLLGGNLFLKSMGAVTCLYFMSLTTSMIDIISVLRKLKVPVIFLDLMMLIYRFIFTLIDTAYDMITSQASRLGYRTTKTSFQSLSRMFSNLFLKAFFRAKALNQSMMSRCYNGEINVLEEKYDVSRKNWVMICTIQSLYIAVAVLWRFVI